MGRILIRLVAGLLLLPVALAVSCARPPSSAPAAAKVLTLGFTASQTGSLNKESTAQLQGTQLWLSDLEMAGGIKLPNGAPVTFRIKYYDDESNKDRVQQLYTRLINEDKADFLLSPYSSGLADAAAVIAEQNGKIMLTTGAASDSTYQRGYQLVFQLYTPASRYLTGALDLLARLDPAAKRVAIVHENDTFSSGVAAAAKQYAAAQGYEVVLYEGYDSATTEFGPFINKISALKPDAILGGGHFQDGSTFVRQLAEKGVPAKMVAILVAPPEPTFAELGNAALGIIGPSQWEPQADYTREAAQAAKLPWYGPTVTGFTEAYRAKFGVDPSYHAAGGYAAGLLLQRAIELAGSTDPAKVKSALEGMNLLTFFGQIKFDTSDAAHGLQIGHEMVYIQWQKGAATPLAKQVIWPLAGKSADALYPLAR
jgi:ABC-type branched-subunit amino acid transport system substrate-binding protein